MAHDEATHTERAARLVEDVRTAADKLLAATMRGDEAEAALDHLRKAMHETERALQRMHEEAVRAVRERAQQMLQEKDREAQALAAQVQAKWRQLW